MIILVSALSSSIEIFDHRQSRLFRRRDRAILTLNSNRTSRSSLYLVMVVIRNEVCSLCRPLNQPRPDEGVEHVVLGVVVDGSSPWRKAVADIVGDRGRGGWQRRRTDQNSPCSACRTCRLPSTRLPIASLPSLCISRRTQKSEASRKSDGLFSDELLEAPWKTECHICCYREYFDSLPCPGPFECDPVIFPRRVWTLSAIRSHQNRHPAYRSLPVAGSRCSASALKRSPVMGRMRQLLKEWNSVEAIEFGGHPQSHPTTDEFVKTAEL